MEVEAAVLLFADVIAPGPLKETGVSRAPKSTESKPALAKDDCGRPLIFTNVEKSFALDPRIDDEAYFWRKVLKGKSWSEGAWSSSAGVDLAVLHPRTAPLRAFSTNVPHNSPRETMLKRRKDLHDALTEYTRTRTCDMQQLNVRPLTYAPGDVAQCRALLARGSADKTYGY